MDLLRTLLMLSKHEVLQLLVALARMNDAAVMSRDEGLSNEVCSSTDRSIVRELRAYILPLRQSFDYTRSPEFRSSVAGKSAAFQGMQQKLAGDPVKRQSQVERFDKALERVLDSDEAFQLLPEEQHGVLLRVRALARTLGNPD
jgi:hypothetical protein